MALSARYTNLHIRIEALKARFLLFDNLESFETENQDRLMSFRLLVHAEIEFFFEEYARSIINSFLNVWVTRKRMLPGLRYLFVYSPSKYDSKDFISVNDRVRNCCASFIGKIDNNHGIKQANIISLFVPLGVTQSYLDNVWLATMDAFGARRGSYAHKSFAVQVQIDKSTELNDLGNVMDGIRKIDSKLQTLLSPTLRKPF
jgi:hypothetical protein